MCSPVPTFGTHPARSAPAHGVHSEARHVALAPELLQAAVEGLCLAERLARGVQLPYWRLGVVLPGNKICPVAIDSL